MATIMQQVPGYLDALFVVITALAGLLFVRSTPRKRTVITVLSVWALATGSLAYAGFFLRTEAMPPLFVLAIGPPLLTIVLLFVLPAGRRYLDELDPSRLTMLHVVRIPVELVLFGLFVRGAVPELMTFAGRNGDILSGISAPFIWYFGYRRRSLSRTVLIAWNLACLGLLFNIVINALLAAPFPFQQQAFDRPNVAILFFPYLWLPAIVVPLVLLAQLATLRDLLRTKSPHA